MVKLSKKNQERANEWAARVEAENLTVGMEVSAKRVTTDARSIVLTEWWEPATIREIRTFDAVVEFHDGTRQSSGLGLKAASAQVTITVRHTSKA
jgi:hypothetical protein